MTTTKISHVSSFIHKNSVFRTMMICDSVSEFNELVYSVLTCRPLDKDNLLKSHNTVFLGTGLNM